MAEKAAAGPPVEGRLTKIMLARLFLPLFTVGLGYGAVLPILPSLLQRLHENGTPGEEPLHASLLTGLYIGAFVVAAPAWGKLTDRHGARRVMVAGLLGYMAATIWFGFAASLTTGYAARFAAGAFAAALTPATSAWIARHCRAEERTRLLAWASAASVVGFLAGPALTGWMHDLLSQRGAGRPGGLHVTAVPIWITAAIALLAALGVSGGLPRQTVAETSAISPRSPNDRSPAWDLRSLLLLSGFGAFGLGAFEVGLTLQSQRSWRLSPSDLAGLFAACSLVMLIIQFALFAPLQQRLPSRTLVIVGFIGMATGFALLPGTFGYVMVVALVTLIALGSGLLLTTLSVATANQAGREVGRAVGDQNATSSLGQAVGSAAAGWLFSALPTGSFTVVAGVMAASAALAALGSGRRPPTSSVGL